MENDNDIERIATEKMNEIREAKAALEAHEKQQVSAFYRLRQIMGYKTEKEEKTPSLQETINKDDYRLTLWHLKHASSIPEGAQHIFLLFNNPEYTKQIPYGKECPLTSVKGSRSWNNAVSAWNSLAPDDRHNVWIKYEHKLCLKRENSGVSLYITTNNLIVKKDENDKIQPAYHQDKICIQQKESLYPMLSKYLFLLTCRQLYEAMLNPAKALYEAETSRANESNSTPHNTGDVFIGQKIFTPSFDSYKVIQPTTKKKTDNSDGVVEITNEIQEKEAKKQQLLQILTSLSNKNKAPAAT